MSQANTHPHLDDGTLTLIADGAGEAVSEAEHAHLAVCDHCADRLADVALLAVRVDDGLRRAPKKLREAARAPVPIAAMLAGLVVAVLGGLANLDAETLRLVVVTARTLGRRAPALLVGLAEEGQLATLVAALGLAAFGIALAFSRSRSIDPGDLR